MMAPSDGTNRMTSPPSRPGMRFTLRSLMIVVALAACYLGYEVNAVRQRKVVLNEFSKRPSIDVVTVERYKQWAVVGPNAQLPRVPWIRRMMGDEAIQEVRIHTNI